jgi:hypothetical protein
MATESKNLSALRQLTLLAKENEALAQKLTGHIFRVQSHLAKLPSLTSVAVRHPEPDETTLWLRFARYGNDWLLRATWQSKGANVPSVGEFRSLDEWSLVTKISVVKALPQLISDLQEITQARHNELSEAVDLAGRLDEELESLVKEGE